MKKLFALYAANKGRGAPLNIVKNAGEVVIEVYDFIVSSESDAEWLGGTPADRFCRALRGMNEGETVHIRINSPGGDVFAGIAMAQAVRECKANVIVHVDGYAASAASLIVAAAPESIIAPGGMVMIHEAWTIELGNKRDFMNSAALLEKIDGEIAATYQAKAGGDVADWMAAMEAETWYTGAEAVAAGLANKVAESATKPKNSFDLGMYAHAPAIEPAPEPAPEPTPEPQNSVEADAATADLERRRRLARAYAPTPA